jgi:hypothetical protein
LPEDYSPAQDMKSKTGTIIALAIVALVFTTIFLFGKKRSNAGVTVTLRLAVSPENQRDFVIRQAESAKFKYIVGTKSGVKPMLAQKLSVKTVPNTSLAEARIDVISKEDGQRYVAAFLETLQADCAGQAQVTLAQQAIE